MHAQIEPTLSFAVKKRQEIASFVTRQFRMRPCARLPLIAADDHNCIGTPRVPYLPTLAALGLFTVRPTILQRCVPASALFKYGPDPMGPFLFMQIIVYQDSQAWRVSYSSCPSSQIWGSSSIGLRNGEVK